MHPEDGTLIIQILSQAIGRAGALEMDLRCVRSNHRDLNSDLRALPQRATHGRVRLAPRGKLTQLWFGNAVGADRDCHSYAVERLVGMPAMPTSLLDGLSASASCKSKNGGGTRQVAARLAPGRAP